MIFKTDEISRVYRESTGGTKRRRSEGREGKGREEKRREERERRRKCRRTIGIHNIVGARA